MKRISINLLTNVLLLLVGVVLIIFYAIPDVLKWVAVVIGVLFFLPSLAYVVTVAFRKAEVRNSVDLLGIFPSVGGMCFGIVMMLKPHLFENVITLLLGLFMLVLGLFHIIYLLLSWRTIGVKAWYLVAPLLVTVAGILVLTLDCVRDNAAIVALFTGVSLLLFNFTSVQEYMAERRLRKSVAAGASTVGPAISESTTATTVEPEVQPAGEVTTEP